VLGCGRQRCLPHLEQAAALQAFGLATGALRGRPLFVQFCANDPDTLLAAARLAEPHCDAIDLNLGCPQHIARRGRYGELLNGQPSPAHLDVSGRQRILDQGPWTGMVRNADVHRSEHAGAVLPRLRDGAAARAGAFLMDELPLVERMVAALAAGLRKPVSVKIRIFPELERTLAYARMLQAAGASLVAVHGRTRVQKDNSAHGADWDAIRVCLGG